MGVPVPKRGGRVASIRSTALRNSYEYRCASNHRASLMQRRGGARKPINTLSQSDWCDCCWNVLRRAVLQYDWCCMIFCSRTNACNPYPSFWDGHAHLCIYMRLNIMVLHVKCVLWWPHGHTNSGCNKEVACLHILL